MWLLGVIFCIIVDLLLLLLLLFSLLLLLLSSLSSPVGRGCRRRPSRPYVSRNPPVSMSRDLPPRPHALQRGLPQSCRCHQPIPRAMERRRARCPRSPPARRPGQVAARAFDFSFRSLLFYPASSFFLVFSIFVSLFYLIFPSHFFCYILMPSWLVKVLLVCT